MDKATQTMIDNLHNNTGKTLEQWTAIVKSKTLQSMEKLSIFLKTLTG